MNLQVAKITIIAFIKPSFHRRFNFSLTIFEIPAEIITFAAAFAGPGGEMVDALVSGTSVRDDVQVRVLSWAQDKPLN